MNLSFGITEEKRKYLSLLAEKYPSIPAVSREIINLNAILNLPKGTEHFMSDLHGEYEAFYHILNNCSGVIREKVKLTFGGILGEHECREICTLIYYPEQKLEMLKANGTATPDWYKSTLKQLIELAKVLSSKYTRSKVRKALPPEFSYIIDELLHAQPDEDNNQYVYHEKILDTIIGIDSSDEFIIALAASIKRLAVDHLHIVGDIFDRGDGADEIIKLLINYHSLDIQWGNHDILWMGAAAGSRACVAAAVRNNIKYNNMSTLEAGYAISLRALTLFAEKTYPEKEEPMAAALKAISIILFKLEGQIIRRHPEYEMDHMLLLDKIDFEKGTVRTGGAEYALNDMVFPTIDPENPYVLTSEEEKVIADLTSAFQNSERLQTHIQFLYAKGAMYRLYNGNLLFHGCIPFDENGNFDGVTIGGRTYLGKAYMDYADKTARRAYFSGDSAALDFMWYLWCGEKSPLFGRKIKTFERMFIDDKTAWTEEKNPYFVHYKSEKTCMMILREFGLFSEISHIINGHTPIHASEGESPIKSNKKLIIIDGGFCKAYQGATGIAGYTLIYNSHGMRIKAHQPFESIEKVLTENKDIESSSDMFETEYKRVMVKDTDHGKNIHDLIDDLRLLLYAYRQGIIAPQITDLSRLPNTQE